jgi:hypothetical protein
MVVLHPNPGGTVKFIAFVVSMVLFLGGLVLMGYSFEPGSGEGLMFFSGLVAIALSIAVPFHLLKRLDG